MSFQIVRSNKKNLVNSNTEETPMHHFLFYWNLGGKKFKE